MEKVLLVEEISKCFGDKAAVDQLSFKDKRGEVPGLVGPTEPSKPR